MPPAGSALPTAPPRLISQKVMNLEALQRIASRGIPWGGGMRALVWKLLLGYLPEDRDSWDGALVEKREAYAKLRSELILNPSESGGEQGGAADGPLERREIPDGDHPLCLGEDSIWHRYFQDAEIATQIDRDLERTHPNSRFFAGDSKSSRINRESMRSILLLFAKLNPAVSYVQGMNEVLAPLFYVFSSDPDAQQASDAEADSFFCFVSLLSNSVDHFCPHLDNSPKGILSTLADLSQLLKANDEELWRHLELSNKVRPQFYAFRWITLLLTQEFGLPAVIRIWDALLGNPSGVQEMLLRVCCAMLLCVRRELLEGDFMANVKLLQSYPRVDLERLLNVAGQVVTPQSRGPT
ncbi:unnamed protein product [Spirodela intermedia]|uniref:Rab-GAP TBC domain-containing protein n=1 Tax=Spirodela intermedia TaxID=51605 RepID=A0A7I8LIL6_SPIIN|nr:unnamed protein product [Spirodela intermedia]